ncbi:MAG: hypothetical protein KJN64_07065, partial [Ignavibacteria bacterium]|nr:hypothetical protein [Ignavibacteria bacterium]
QTFEIDITEVEIEYFEFLNSFSVKDWQAKANYYFGRQSLIQKVCPRYISDRIADAWYLINQKNYEDAEQLLNEVLEKTDNYSAIVGLSVIYENYDSLNSAIRILEEKLEIFKNTSYEYNLIFRLADLLVKAGRFEEAKVNFETLKNSKPNLRLELLAQLRLILMKEEKISDYVFGSDYDKYFLLKELNLIQHNYSSIPIMINLSERLNENYKLFLSNLINKFEVKDFYSSYAALKLSQYMLQNFDYLNARKLAGLSLRYKNDNGLVEYKKENFRKAEWFHKNAGRILDELKISND